jgi:hypothetical protein
MPNRQCAHRHRISTDRLVRSDLGPYRQFWKDYGLFGSYSGPEVRSWEIPVASAKLRTEGLQVRALAGHSDDEKPRSARPQDLRQAFGPTSIQFKRFVAPRVPA